MNFPSLFFVELPTLHNIQNSALIYVMVKFTLFDILEMNDLLQDLLNRASVIISSP